MYIDVRTYVCTYVRTYIQLVRNLHREINMLAVTHCISPYTVL